MKCGESNVECHVCRKGRARCEIRRANDEIYGQMTDLRTVEANLKEKLSQLQADVGEKERQRSDEATHVLELQAKLEQSDKTYHERHWCNDCNHKNCDRCAPNPTGYDPAPSPDEIDGDLAPPPPPPAKDSSNDNQDVKA